MVYFVTHEVRLRSKMISFARIPIGSELRGSSGPETLRAVVESVVELTEKMLHLDLTLSFKNEDSRLNLGYDG